VLCAETWSAEKSELFCIISFFLTDISMLVNTIVCLFAYMDREQLGFHWIPTMNTLNENQTYIICVIRDSFEDLIRAEYEQSMCRVLLSFPWVLSRKTC